MPRAPPRRHLARSRPSDWHLKDVPGAPVLDVLGQVSSRSMRGSVGLCRVGGITNRVDDGLIQTIRD
jgi:hypothetical protein